MHKVKAYGCALGQPQYEATKAYMPKEPDELGLKQAELVIVFQTEEGNQTFAQCASFFFWVCFFCWKTKLIVPLYTPLVSMVLRRENAWWREGLVPCELRYRDHQPHGHGEQRSAHEEAAQRNQRLNTTRDSITNLCHLLLCFAKHKKSATNTFFER